jgi:hypothetical protein
LNPPLSANSPTAVLSGLAIGGHMHNSIDNDSYQYVGAAMSCLSSSSVCPCNFLPSHSSPSSLPSHQDKTINTTSTLTSSLQASSNLIHSTGLAYVYAPMIHAWLHAHPHTSIHSCAPLNPHAASNPSITHRHAARRTITSPGRPRLSIHHPCPFGVCPGVV